MAANPKNLSRPSLENFQLCVQSVCPMFNVSSFNPLTPVLAVTGRAKTHPQFPGPAVTGRAKTHPKFPVPAVKKHVRTIAFPTLPEEILVLLLFYCC